MNLKEIITSLINLTPFKSNYNPQRKTQPVSLTSLWCQLADQKIKVNVNDYGFKLNLQRFIAFEQQTP